ncbi:universal stress protein [Natranaeroarchaeum sulfidigenes]|uniref:Nucleotide-binding protein, UspA family n=1 Tax=Natranaeroarchaeum sulfidigenes TaxID=2784880 RepID=A0A897MR28_9EURY|nr:universal stress protein [Natranaeroarchaeum sulfidigenes]QSG01463.1 Nucleotide-binding protein, UspA family [Natranaeroarchaeum sulfidigenes]
MDSILVLISDEEPNDQLLSAAVQYVSGSDTSVVVCRLVDEERYRSGIQQDARSGAEMNSVAELEESAKAEALSVSESAFPADVATTAIGIVGVGPDAVLDIADEYDCDHVFLAGRKRSPVGKALFGDLTQQVVLEFDGPVTIVTSDD